MRIERLKKELRKEQDGLTALRSATPRAWLEERELRSLEERCALNHIRFRASLEAKAFNFSISEAAGFAEEKK